MQRTLASTLFGLALGIALLLACGDDSPHGADAGDCSCPEPLLTDRIVLAEPDEATIGPNSVEIIASGCDEPGQIVISGGCSLGDTSTGGDLLLMEAGIAVDTEHGTPGAWFCRWRNTGGQTTTVVASATCLNPPAAP
jgi:hypothetical protein